MNESQKIKDLEDRIAKLEALIGARDSIESVVLKENAAEEISSNTVAEESKKVFVKSEPYNENIVTNKVYSGKELFIEKHKSEINTYDSSEDEAIQKVGTEHLIKQEEVVADSADSHKVDIEDTMYDFPEFDMFFSRSVQIIKKNLLAIIGFIMVISAVAWFLGHAFAQGWIGVIGRVSMAYIFSSILLLIGNKYFQKKRIFSSLLLVISLSTVLMTTTLALNRYELFNQNTAYIIMLLASTLNVVIGYKKNSEAFIIFSLLAAFISPFLTGVVSDSSLFLAHNFTLFFVGTFVALRKSWMILLVLSYILGTLLPFFTVLSQYPNQVIVYGLLFLVYTYVLSIIGNVSLLRVAGVIVSTLYFVEINSSFDLIFYPTIYAVIAWLILLLAILKSNYRKTDFSIEDVSAIIISSFTSFLYILVLQQEYLFGLTILSFSVNCLLLTVITKRSSFPSYLPLVFSLISLVFFVIATLVQAPSDYIPLILVLQWGFVSYLAAFVFKIESMFRISNIFWVPVYLNLLLTYLFSIQDLTILNIVVFVLLILFLQLVPRLYKELTTDNSTITYDVLTLLLVSLFIWNLNQYILQMFNFKDYLSFANAISLYWFTIAGLIMFTLQNRYKNFKLLSYILLAITIIRLMFVEYWNMSLVPRVIIFLVIGLILVFTAYFEKKYINPKYE